jgi:hypothetical protein
MTGITVEIDSVFIIIAMAGVIAIALLLAWTLLLSLRHRDHQFSDMLNRFMAGEWREYAKFQEIASMTAKERTNQIKIENDMTVKAAKIIAGQEQGQEMDRAKAGYGYPIS